MSREVITYERFFETVPEEQKGFVAELHKYLMEYGCSMQIKQARSGYMVSYIGSDKKTIFNYLFRKTGMQVRIYANHVHEYPQVLEMLPEGMVMRTGKAGECKRMLDPTACNSRCSMGYDFVIAGKRYQKCRNAAFHYPMNEEYHPYLRMMIEQELECICR